MSGWVDAHAVWLDEGWGAPLVSLQPMALLWVAHLWLSQSAVLQHPGTLTTGYKPWRIQAAALTISCSVEVVGVDGDTGICQCLAGISSSLQGNMQNSRRRRRCGSSLMHIAELLDLHVVSVDGHANICQCLAKT